ncbi:hypothetical protein [Candidatus Poriferisodalis sp.]|uniref:hypothetical protein n=1 Tax=Candidatus Poriferisodalis sp. TaxID=3101277 RepID=UPI003D09A20B
MNAGERLQTIQTIHDSQLRIVLSVTGGGVLALSDLLTIPGGSRTILEAGVPYSVKSLYELMGSDLEPHVSDEAALAMADGCLARAQYLVSTPRPGTEPWPLAGISCTAALVTDPPRRGEDRAHIAAVTDSGTRIDRKITYGTDDRIAQDRETSDALLELIAEIATS